MVICHLSPKGSINILVCFVKKYRDSLIIISSYASQKILTKIDLFNNENAIAVVCGRLGAWLRAEESQGTLDDLQSLNICYLGLELVNAPLMKNESETRIQWRRRPAPTSQHHHQAGRLSCLHPAESGSVLLSSAAALGASLPSR